MYNTNSPRTPADRSIDIRMRVLGVLGFLLLAGVFFTVGVLYIGPWMRPSPKPITPESASGYHLPRRSADEDQPKEEIGPDIKLEVTEQGVDSVPGAQETSDSGVKVDENGLTITLDGKAKHPSAGMPTAVEKPSVSTPAQDAVARPTGGSSLERPRAATEKHDAAYKVQIGLYSSRATADDLASKLKNNGYRRATVTQTQTKDRTLYRVQVGQYKTSLDAEELSKDLKAQGYQPAIVTE